MLPPTINSACFSHICAIPTAVPPTRWARAPSPRHVTVRRIVVVSGPVAGGKSHLARGLASRFGGVRLSTRELLMPALAPGEAPTRAALQRIGAKLDTETDGRWVADRLSRRIYDAGERLVIIDAARIAGQIEGLRRAFGREVRHVHVGASREACAVRYEQRRQRADVQEAESYDDVIAIRRVVGVRRHCDIVAVR